MKTVVALLLTLVFADQARAQTAQVAQAVDITNTEIQAAVQKTASFAKGKIDAFLGFPPEPQELRSRNIGHVIVRPWSQYFCCMLAARREYVRKYPVATKRVLRAIIKGADLCGSEPERVAQRIVDGDLLRGMITRCGPSRKSPTPGGEITIPKIRSDSTRCGCARPA